MLLYYYDKYFHCIILKFIHFFFQGDLFSESAPSKKSSKKIVESDEEEEEEEGMQWPVNYACRIC